MKQRVFHVPIAENRRDYEKVEYEKEYLLTQDDIRKLEKEILEIKNNTEVKGDVLVHTSIGEITIEYKKSPDTYRTKIIEGFIYRDEISNKEILHQDLQLHARQDKSIENSALQRIFTLLQDLSPVFEKSHHSMILKNSLHNIQCDLKLPDKFENFFIFNIILHILQAMSDEFGQDQRSSVRIKNEIMNIQSLYSDEDKQKVQEFLHKFSSIFRVEG